MAVYNINGNKVELVYDVSSERLQQVYDINKNRLLVDSIVVMSYNVQDYKGINAQQAMQNAIISKYDADIIGVQEFYGTDTIPTIASSMFNGYNLYRSNHKNFIAIASKSTLSDITVADYQSQDPKDMSQYSETRSYIKGYFTHKGKRICFINTHLCFLTTSYKYQQMSELFALAENEEYCIITGDFNFFGLSVSDNDYINMYKPFVDAGYNLANCTEDRGFTKTYSNSTTATSLDDFTNAADNIIVSGNININNVIYDLTKLNYLNGSVIDHIPIIATLQIADN